jgi:chaperonin GroES
VLDIFSIKESIMSLQPLRDFIVVSVPKVAEEKVGLLYKPATVEQKIVTGTIVAAGSGYLTDGGTIVPLEVKAGDTILFSKSMSVEVSHNGETMFLLREEHVLSVVR